jgi:endonuclease III
MSLEDYCSRHDLIDDILEKAKVIRKHVEKYLSSESQEWSLLDIEDDVKKFLLSDPLAYIIGAICDQQIKAEAAWSIPKVLHEELKKRNLEFKASVIYRLGEDEVRKLLEDCMKNIRVKGKWGRLRSKKARERWLQDISSYIVKTCELIAKRYNDDPDKMLLVSDGKLNPPLLYFIFRQLHGIGPKKATMLSRDFASDKNSYLEGVRERLQRQGVNLVVEQKYFTEIPVDVHILRVVERIFGSEYTENQDIQNLGRLIYPENPGLVDYYLWDFARKICINDEREPKCNECPFTGICRYYRCKKR